MSGSDKLDQITAAFKRALDILFVANPEGTSLGVFAGVSAHGFVQMLQEKLDKMLAINTDAAKTYHYVALGVVIFNFPRYINRNKLDPKIEEALEYIREQVANGTVNEWQAKHMYVELHSKVLSSIVLNEKTETSRRRLKESLTKRLDVDQ